MRLTAGFPRYARNDSRVGHPHLIDKWDIPQSEQCEDIIVRCTISSQSDITAAGDIMCAAYACASPAKRGILSHFPTFIKKSISKDLSWRAGAGMLAHIRVHSRVTRSLTHVIIQNMHFIYYIPHKIIKICKIIA